jgi:1-acyl-sn-glycerol-3-phosphate acyltransferase
MRAAGSIRAIGLIAGFGVLTVPAVAIQSVLALMHKPSARVFPNLYFRSLCKLLGIVIDIDGEVMREKPGLWVVNHVSWLDIVILGAVRPVTFVAKRQVAHWPVFGWMARAGRTIFIERDRRHKTGHAKAMVEGRLGENETVVLFAEGTSSDGNRVLPFKSALLGAVQGQINDRDIAVQPVSLAYTHRHGIVMGRAWRPFYAWFGDMDLVPHLWQAAAKGPLTVRLVFHEPVHSSSLGGRKALAQHCEQAVRAGLARALFRGAPGAGQLTLGAKPVRDAHTMEFAGQ